MPTEVILSTIGLICALVIIAIGLFRGLPALVVTPIAALVVIFSAGLNFTEATNTFFSGAGTMVVAFLPLLLGSSIFGACFTATGGAEVLANFMASTFGVKRVIPCCVILSMLLAYANMGYAGYLITLGIGVVLCKQGNYPARILPGCIFLGGWTITLGGPFAPSPINLLPGQQFGTGPYGGAVIGLAGYAFTIIAGIIYLNWQMKRWIGKGEGFSANDQRHLEGTEVTEFVRPSVAKLIITLLPILVYLLLLNAVQLHAFWSAIVSTLVIIAINFKKFTPQEWFDRMGKGSLSVAVPVASFAIIGAFGTLSRVTPLYQFLIDNLDKVTINPYVMAVLSTNMLAGVFGSGSTAVALGLTSLSDYFMQFGTQGYSLASIGRLISMSATGMDSIPCSGSVYSAFNVLGYSYKESYFPVFICSVVLTICGTVLVALPLALLGL